MHMENMVMGIAFGTAVTAFRNCRIAQYKGTYNHVRYENIVGDTPKEFPIQGNRFAQISTDNFSKIPGSPVAYWVSDRTIESFQKGILADIADTKQGFATGDNNRFLKFWQEVDWNTVGMNCDSREKAKESLKKWFPTNKGGSYRRWYGNNIYLANWKNDGEEMRAFSGSVIRNPQYYGSSLLSRGF